MDQSRLRVLFKSLVKLCMDVGVADTRCTLACVQNGQLSLLSCRNQLLFQGIVAQFVQYNDHACTTCVTKDLCAQLFGRTHLKAVRGQHTA